MKNLMNHTARIITIITLACAQGYARDGGSEGGKETITEKADPVIKEGEHVSLKGKLSGGMMGIGGETTGWQLAYETKKGKATIMVDMTAIKDADKMDGKEVTVSGTIISKTYVERGVVLILKAEKVS